MVEDNDLNREVLCALLSERYDILQARDGQEALEVLKQNPARVSLVILDIQMPVMDGYGFLEAVSADSRLREVPVMVATGSNSFEEEERCLTLGAVDFVAKPYRPNVVQCRVENIIRLNETSSTLEVVETDALTGLYVKAAFFHYASDLIKEHSQSAFNLVVFSVADLSTYNEMAGTEKCDALIRQIAAAMRDFAEDGTLLSRTSGSTFALLHQSANPESTVVLARQITNKINQLSLGPSVRLSAGVCCAQAGVLVETLYERALRTSRSVRDSYGNAVVEYDEVMRAEDERRMRVEATMESALENGEFKVFYQPKCCSCDGSLVGAEALVRWIRPDGTMVSPADFVPLLEANGFIARIDRYVWARTAANLRGWQDAGVPVVPISVNVSKRDFMDGDFVRDRLELLCREGVEPRLMSVEVTESLFSENVADMTRMMSKLREHGIKVALDDFGSGYSSLSRLLVFPLDVVKLDMSFMRNLDDPRHLSLLEASIRLMKSLGFLTVSEGVETAEQAELIRSLGGDAIQGYYCSKPLSERDFEQYLKENA